MDLPTAEAAAGIVAGLNAINAMSGPLGTLVQDQAVVVDLTASDPQSGSNVYLNFGELVFTAPESAQIVAAIQNILNARFQSLNAQLAALNA